MRKLSQYDVAKLVGCNQSYICHIETGRRPVSLEMAKKLEIALQAKGGSYRKAEFRRGRPPCSEATKVALRHLTRAQGASPRRLLNLGTPCHPRPDRQYGLDNPFWPIANFLGEKAQSEVVQLEKLRPKQNHFWRQMNSLTYQSWTEKRFQVRVGLTGADLVGLSARRLGAVLPAACGRTGRDASQQAYPSFILQHEDLSIAIIPQRCVGTGQTYRWADNLVVAARNGRKVTGVIETDGAEFHSNAAKEKRRDEELGVPVLHIDAADVGNPDLMERIFTWLRGLFP